MAPGPCLGQLRGAGVLSVPGPRAQLGVAGLPGLSWKLRAMFLAIISGVKKSTGRRAILFSGPAGTNYYANTINTHLLDPSAYLVNQE